MKTYKSATIKLISETALDSSLGGIYDGYDLWIRSRKGIVQGDSYSDNFLVGKEEVGFDEYSKRILKMNLQYNNFPYFVFEINGSILFRDILFNINKTSQWSVSLRFMHSVHDRLDESNFPISEEYKGIKEWEDAFDKYYDLVKIEPNTDRNRVLMPYSMSSTYWIGINLKSLVSLLGMLKLKMPFIYNLYGKLIEAEVLHRLGLDVSSLYRSEVDSGISQYFLGDAKSSEESCSSFGNHFSLNTKLSMILFSQFLRQSEVCVSGFYDILEHSDPEEFKHKVITGSTEMMINYVAHKDRVKKTVSNRLCWFSQSDGDEQDSKSWSKFLNLFIKEVKTVEQFKEFLPCKFSGDKLCDCAFKDDVKFRNEGLEKSNLPCSILSNNLSYAEQRYDNCKNQLNSLYLDLTKTLK